MSRTDPRPSPDEWPRIEALLGQLLDLPSEQRSACLDTECAGDPLLRQRLHTLIDAAEHPGPIDRAAIALAEWVTDLDAPGLQAGAAIGSYVVVEQLGAGGMGEVWKAHDTTLGRDVAIKMLPPAFAADRERLVRFEREAKLLASLNHPNIATIHELERTDGTISIVMELVEGETLAERLARGPMDPREATRVAQQIAEALEAAHEKGIVHRDLKPANVKLTPDGRVKVLDFGLAKIFEEENVRPDPTRSAIASPAASRQGMVLGTAAYMSPEQASGSSVDRRADVWSFGVVFFEMLAGRRLFPGETVTDVLGQVLGAQPAWSALPSRLHPRLRFLLERCLEKDARRREHDIADVRMDLQRALADPDGVLTRPTPRAPVATSRRGGAVAAGLLAIVIGGAAGWLLKPVNPRQPDRSFYELPEGAELWNSNYASIALSADGRRIAYSTSDGVFVASRDEFEPRLVPGTEPAEVNAFDLMMSPDGESIAYLTGIGGHLQKLSVWGGPPITLATPSTQYGGGSWTSDNHILFAQRGAVMKVSADGGTVEKLFDVAEGGAHSMPQLLSDGRTVSYSVRRDSGLETVIRRADGSTSSFPGSGARYLPTGHVVFLREGSLFVQPFDLGRGRVSGSPVRVVENVMGDPFPQFAVSAGTLVYAPGVASTQLVPAIVSAGGDRRELPGIPSDRYSSPRVSPDGASLALQTTETAPLSALQSRIWVYNLSGETAFRPLTHEGKNVHPIWTLDGERLTFFSDRNGAPGIYMQRADGTGMAERLTTSTEGVEHWPDSWSPDGRTLVYQVIDRVAGMVDLWVLELDEHGVPQRTGPIFAAPERQHGAAISRDGRWIAYGSTEGSPGAEQIWVEPFPSTGERHQVTRQSGAFPLWSPTGAPPALFYRRHAMGTVGEPASQLMQVDIVDAEPFRWRSERPLDVGTFQVWGGFRDYDVLPDGRFVMLFRPAGAEPRETERHQVHVILNWTDELRARGQLN